MLDRLVGKDRRPVPSQPPAPTLHSLPLLDNLLKDALDPGYADAAARRRKQVAAGYPHHRSYVYAGLGLAALGILAAVAIGQQQAGAPDAARARTRLVNQISVLTSNIDLFTKQLNSLRAQTAFARDRELALSKTGTELAALVRSLELDTGVTPMSGAGLTVRLSDSAKPIAGGSTRDEGRIQDRDVQDVVNALWAGGARGVSVNGIRLTAQTAIRTAGQAILVDFRAQLSPYVVTAVGDPDQLQVSFNDSPVARRFSTWTQLYGLGFSVSRSKSLNLAAAAPIAPRHARRLAPVTSSTGAPSSPPSPSTK